MCPLLKCEELELYVSDFVEFEFKKNANHQEFVFLYVLCVQNTDPELLISIKKHIEQNNRARFKPRIEK